MHLKLRIPARRRVSRGAKWLDKVLPGWYNGKHLLDTSTLNLGSCDFCMLGQLEVPLRQAMSLRAPATRHDDTLLDSGYMKFLRALYPDKAFPLEHDVKGDRFAKLMGCELETGDPEGYNDLTDYWLDEIDARRTKAGIS